MLGWGISNMLLSAANTFAGVVILRFLLGTFEAALFPGIIYCSTFWYRPDERALRIALVIASSNLGAHTSSTGVALGVHDISSWSFQRGHRLCSRAHERRPGVAGMEMAFHHRGCTLMPVRCILFLFLSGLSGNEQMAIRRRASPCGRKAQGGRLIRSCKNHMGGHQSHTLGPTNLSSLCHLHCGLCYVLQRFPLYSHYSLRPRISRISRSTFHSPTVCNLVRHNSGRGVAIG